MHDCMTFITCMSDMHDRSHRLGSLSTGSRGLKSCLGPNDYVMDRYAKFTIATVWPAVVILVRHCTLRSGCFAF